MTKPHFFLHILSWKRRFFLFSIIYYTNKSMLWNRNLIRVQKSAFYIYLSERKEKFCSIRLLWTWLSGNPAQQETADAPRRKCEREQDHGVYVYAGFVYACIMDGGQIKCPPSRALFLTTTQLIILTHTYRRNIILKKTCAPNPIQYTHVLVVALARIEIK